MFQTVGGNASPLVSNLQGGGVPIATGGPFGSTPEGAGTPGRSAELTAAQSALDRFADAVEAQSPARRGAAYAELDAATGSREKTHALLRGGQAARLAVLTDMAARGRVPAPLADALDRATGLAAGARWGLETAAAETLAGTARVVAHPLAAAEGLAAAGERAVTVTVDYVGERLADPSKVAGDIGRAAGWTAEKAAAFGRELVAAEAEGRAEELLGVTAATLGMNFLPTGRAANLARLARAADLDAPRTLPTGAKGGEPTGEVKAMPSKPANYETMPGRQKAAFQDNKRAIGRENETARVLARDGYTVHQPKDGEIGADVLRANRLNGEKNPDLIVEGKVFDVYAPKSSDVTHIADKTLDKAKDLQTQRVVVNLSDTKVTRAQLEAELQGRNLGKLIEVKTIDQQGRVGQIDLPQAKAADAK